MAIGLALARVGIPIAMRLVEMRQGLRRNVNDKQLSAGNDALLPTRSQRDDHRLVCWVYSGA